MEYKSNQSDRPLEKLFSYPRFDEREISLVFRNNWQDGPIDGLISYREKLFWFNFHCDTDEPGNPYYYLVYPLTDVEADFAIKWDREKERYAKQWSFEENKLVYHGQGNEPHLEEKSAWFAAHQALLPDYTKREPVGWFSSGSNSSFYGVQLTIVPRLG